MLNLRTIFRTTRALLLAMLLAAMGGMLTACSTGSYGHLDFQLAVNNVFESGEVLPDYNYYFIGPEAEPVAIIAVDKKYQLAPSLWKKIDLTPVQLKAWMSRIGNKYRLSNFYDGAYIIDQHGNRVGMWYARPNWTTIQSGKDNLVTIYTPDITSSRALGSRNDFEGLRGD